jgi:1,4-alpha-glucan branching enzyme
MFVEEPEVGERTGDELDTLHSRRLPVGAEMLPEGGVHFRVWASCCQRVEVVIEAGPGLDSAAVPWVVELTPEGDGFFSGVVSSGRAGMLYRYRSTACAWLPPKTSMIRWQITSSPP